MKRTHQGLIVPGNINMGRDEPTLEWEQEPVPGQIYQLLLEAGAQSVTMYRCTNEELRCIIALEPIGVAGFEPEPGPDDTTIIVPKIGLGYHLSISHRDRYPTWDEQREARYELLPDEVCMVQVLPPAGDYLNVQPNTFHWWQVAIDLLPFVPLPAEEAR